MLAPFRHKEICIRGLFQERAMNFKRTMVNGNACPARVGQLSSVLSIRVEVMKGCQRAFGEYEEGDR
jgi:hypothetical protein